MTTLAIDALHDIHTATHDILNGYSEMLARAEPEVHGLILRLTEMHEKHAEEQAAELARLQESAEGHKSAMGTVNKWVVILRDLFTDIDRDVLPAVRDGENFLRSQYDDALSSMHESDRPYIASMMKVQREQIQAEISRLPQV